MSNSIQPVDRKTDQQARSRRVLTRKVKLGLSFAGVMALIISLPLIMIALTPKLAGGSVVFTDSSLDERFETSGMTGTASNPYVFEGLVLSAGSSDPDYGWKWIFSSTTRHVVIRDCTFVGTGQVDRAITLDYARNVRIEGCRIQGFGSGVFADHATDILVIDNILLLNRVGINLSASLFISCAGNHLMQNTVGITVDAASLQNSFTLNNFTRNTIAAADAGSGNSWSVNEVGNYYDDYLAIYPSAAVASEYLVGAITSVMVASEPYAIANAVPQGAGTPNTACDGHHDCFPLIVCPKGAPSLGVALPLDNALHASIPPSYQVVLNGWAVTALYYTIDDQPAQYSILGGQLLYANIMLSGTINLTAWAELNTEVHEITFHVQNWWGQETNLTVNVEKDVTAPSLLVTSPVEHSVIGSSAPTYALSATDPHLGGITYSVGSSSQSFPAGTAGTIDSAAWLAQPDGDVSLHFRANDTLGNVNETVVVVCKDTTPPGYKVWFDTPGTNRTVHLAPPAFTIEIADPHYASAWYVIDSATFPITGYTGVIDGTIWANQVDGAVAVSFHAVDSLGLETVIEVMLQKDTQGPSLTAIAPGVNGVFGTSAPWFKLDVIEPHLSQIWYSLDGGVMNFTCGTQGYLYQGAWVLLPNGTATIDFYANDTLGSISHVSISIAKDIAPPEIVIYDPQPTTIAGYEPFNYSISVVDAYYESAWYTLDDGITNYSIYLFNGTVYELAWSAVPPGSVTFHVYARDYLGNIGTAAVTFSRDLAPPNIAIVLPVSGTIFGNSSPSFNFHVWDQGLNSVWYEVGEGGVQFDLPLGPVVEGTVDGDTWGALPDGPIYLYFHANDTAGNHDCKAVLVVKDSTIPVVSVSVFSPLFGTAPPEVRCSIVDAHEDVSYYTLDEQALQYPMDGGAIAFVIDLGAWAVLGDIPHVLTLHARDQAGNYANATVIIEKDATVPAIDIEVLGIGVYGQVPPTLDVLITDAHMGGVYAYVEVETLEGLLYPFVLSLDGTQGNATAPLPPSAWRHLWDGSFEVTIYYADAANNTGSAQFTVGIDKTAPELEVTQPTDGAIVGEDGVQFGLWVSDPHLSAIWYTLDFGATNYTLSSQEGNVDPAAWASMWEYGRSITIQIYANDTLGNEACVTVVVICESKPPLWQRLGVTGWAIIIGAVVCIVISITIHARRLAKKREGLVR